MKARSVGKFVQIGSVIINMALVVEGDIGENEIRLHFTPRADDLEEEYPITLRGDARLAFLDWWEHQAELTRLIRAAQLLQLVSRPPIHPTRVRGK